jgi:hypothetical protein
MTRSKSISLLAGATVIQLAALVIAGRGGTAAAGERDRGHPQDRERTVGVGRRRDHRPLPMAVGVLVMLFVAGSRWCSTDPPALRRTGRDGTGRDDGAGSVR